MKNCVVIPIYKEVLDKDELASLLQCEKVLNKHDIKFVCPKSLNTAQYESFKNAGFVRLNDDYFKSVYTYSRMLLDKNFYEQFNDYEYMLVYQLDAWVFEDRLDEWCEKGYDYIGAPWFKGFGAAKKKAKMHPYSGNGGLSLRKISSLINVLTLCESSNKKLKTFYDLYTKEGRGSVFNVFRLPKSLWRYFSKENMLKNALETTNECEDNVISNTFRRIYPQFKVAKASAAKFFAFEALPERLFKECGNKLPFGCHAFRKYNWDFWKNHIEIQP